MNVSSLVFETLDSNWPASVERDSVTVTGEGSQADIVLIPHRQLGGFCLAIWANDDGIDFTWAGVTNLSTHDQLDLGLRVARFATDSASHENVRRQLTAEIDRPVSLAVKRRVFYRNLYCTIFHNDRPWRVFVGRAPSGYEGNEITSLGSRNPVKVDLPVPIANWRKWA